MIFLKINKNYKLCQAENLKKISYLKDNIYSQGTYSNENTFLVKVDPVKELLKHMKLIKCYNCMSSMLLTIIDYLAVD